MQNRSPSPVSDDQCALKTEGVRIQDLSIQQPRARASGSASPPPPPPLAARRDEQVSLEPASTTSALRSSPLKRKNKRASLSPSAKKKTSLSDVVVAEGELVVAEEREQRERDAVVLRTLGSIFCVLVVKNNVSLHLETISEHKHHLIDLDIAHTELVQLAPTAANDDTRKFKLRFRCFAQGRPSAYVFECATRAQCSKWVDAIAGFHNISGSGQSSSDGGGRGASRPSSSGHSVSRHTRASTAQQSAASRRVRSIASLCGDLPHASQQQVLPGLGPGPCSSFLYTAPPRTRHVLLVRHGHYINAHARGVSDTHQVLSQLGRQQAEFTGTYLEQLYARAPTRHDLTISHSDLTRAVETAQTVSKHFGHCALSATRLLREGWPGRPYSSHEPVPQIADAAANHAELARIDAERMELAFQTFFMQPGGGSSSSSSSGGHVQSGGTDDGDDDDGEEQLSYHVIVCHANLIRFFLCRVMGIEPTGRWGHFEINHCGVTRVDVCEHRPLKIISVNETGHLPHSLITSSEDHL